MRRATALIAGLVLVGGLVGCGQDSSGDANEEFCTGMSDLQTNVDEFHSMAKSGASIEDLRFRRRRWLADAKDLSADTQRLEDQQAKDDMNAATLQLETAVGSVDLATMSAEEATTVVTTAVDPYEQTAQQVATQVGCTTG